MVDAPQTSAQSGTFGKAGECDDDVVVEPESNERRFRRVYRTALATKLGPTLLDLGFEGGKGEYVTSWNEDFDLRVMIRESKWNRFGSSTFDVLLSSSMTEKGSRRVRWIWKPTPERGGDWRFESDDAVEGLGQKMIDAVLRSAVPLALDDFGPPSNQQLAELARRTGPDDARAIGDRYVMDWDS